jgi:hypothetical protein
MKFLKLLTLIVELFLKSSKPKIFVEKVNRKKTTGCFEKTADKTVMPSASFASSYVIIEIADMGQP